MYATTISRCALLWLLLLSQWVAAQSAHTVSGYVTDKENGERLAGATVYVSSLRQGTSANDYGFYSLTVAADTVTLLFSFVGYAPVKKVVALSQDVRLDIELGSNTVLKEVEVTASPEETTVEQLQMSVHEVSMQTIRNMPVIGGETDILKTLQLLPGVKSGNEGTSGLYVRGGSPDQNLILLDGVPVYNVSHLFGFLSVFNTDAINKVELIKGGIPARYGGRLSSVLDISMKEGNLKEGQGVFALSPIAGRITYEAPIIKNRSSFIVSARRTWLDFAAVIASLTNDRTFGYGFYDINAKYNHKLNANNRLYLSFYTGRDRFYDTYNQGAADKSIFTFNWGNLTSVLRWNKIFGPKLFSNFALSYSTYNFFQEYEVRQDEARYYYRNRSQIRDWKLQTDFDYAPAPAHSVKFGTKTSWQRFAPEVVQVANVGTDTTFNNQQAVDGINAEAYIEDEISLTDRWRTNVGLRGAAFVVNGKTYANLQPRAAVRYLFNPGLSLKASYTNMAQYLHLLTNSSLGLPTDLWVSSTENIAPQRSDQVTLGIAKNIKQPALEVTLETYYKRMHHLITYREGSSYLYQNGENWEDKVVSGDGESYGAELFVNKQQGKLTGWLGYTLSYTNRWFDAIEHGRKFPFKYDRRHDVSLLLSYHFPKKNLLSFTFVYGTGSAVTLPVARYQGLQPSSWQYNNETYYKDAFNSQLLLGRRNSYRMPAYHRMDVSYHINREKKGTKRSWIFSVYNLYNRRNPYFLYEAKGKLKQYSLFPIIPSVTYRREF